MNIDPAEEVEFDCRCKWCGKGMHVEVGFSNCCDECAPKDRVIRHARPHMEDACLRAGLPVPADYDIDEALDDVAESMPDGVVDMYVRALTSDLEARGAFTRPPIQVCVTPAIGMTPRQGEFSVDPKNVLVLPEPDSLPPGATGVVVVKNTLKPNDRWKAAATAGRLPWKKHGPDRR